MNYSLRRMIPFRLHPVANKAFAISGLMAALLATPAFADDVADVTKLLQGGQFGQAIAKADAYLAKNPRDAQMRFLKGVILSEQNKSSEAIAIFNKLTEDYPNLPEPYNNLAVLYAANGQYEKARVALDTAIRTNPSYATAYENLGDVHAKLASQAYDKALQLDSTNSTAKSKLTLVHSLVGSMGNGPAAAKPASVAAPAPAPKVAAAPVVAAKPEPTKSETKAEAKSEPKAETKVASNNDADEEEALNLVHAWAKAWSSQDVKSYLSFYGSDFKPPKGLSRKAWEEERRARIAGKGSIRVKVESPRVSISGNTATVKFHQNYVSDQLSASSHKTLVLTKHGSRWQIKQENSG